jgi:agmatine deiminase
MAVFRMPAEWAPHEATWLAWPHNPKDWPGKFPPIHWIYVEIVRHLHRHERVEILVEDDGLHRRVRKMLSDAGVDLDQVGFHRMGTDRSWVRDSGPTFITDGNETAAVCWRFNAWAKYSNWLKDVLVARKIAEIERCRPITPEFHGERIVLEGGAIDSNGAGSLLTTEECLLSEDVQQRNPGMTRADYEAVFAEHLGVTSTIWLERGIAGDDTHGHVDDLARFVGPRTVATVLETDRKDENYAPLKRNWEFLTKQHGQDGKPLDVIELPMPKPLYFRGVRMPASYANFYIANGLVLVPTFHDPNDRIALNVLASAFPGREVIGIHSVDFVWGFGTLHCSTQQQPLGHVCG